MSNVYKYYVPQGKTDQTRSIGGNAAAEERLRQRIAEAEEAERRRMEMLAAAQEEEEAESEEAEEDGEGGFAEGLFAPRIDPESGEIIGEADTFEEGEEGEYPEDMAGELPEGEDSEEGAEPEEPYEEEEEPGLPPQFMEEAEAIIAAAKAQADEALIDAQGQAEQIIAEAKADAEKIKADANRNGYEEGLEQGRAEAEQEKAAALDALEQQRQQMEAEKESALQELEPQLLQVILQVFNRVFHIQFDDKKEILEYLVINTIMNIEGSKEFRIKTSEENLQYLSAHLSEIRAQVGQEYNIEVVADSTLHENQCVIETDSGYFDCSIDVHLENLIKDLKSLAP